ncbi:MULTISPECIES: hypothetical protein [unclassified Curtobacterium]|uniref:hypothetical protein n=1 Tax=unclassified Curtobacterium TaxID=257496 RepID=UPI00226B65FE|nr:MULTISPECIES: hypothetical protein [unclassified Curtobacterium]
MRASVIRFLVLSSGVLLGVVALVHRSTGGAACALVLLAVTVLVRDPVVVEQEPELPPTHLPAEPDIPAAATLDALPVGTDPDGRLVHLDATLGVVVIGHGALAVGVFTALAAALSAAADDTHDVRLAAGDGVALPAGRRGMAAGAAVAVVLDASGVRVASVVVVPDLRTLPRGPASTVEVSRYGCTVRADPEAPRGVAVAPALPALEPAGTATSTSAASDDPARATA